MADVDLATLAQRAGVSPEGLECVAGEPTADAYLKRLMDGGHYLDGIRFLAHAMPNRQAAWWMCLAAWKMVGPQPAPEAEEGLRLAVEWVLEPDKDRQRQAMLKASVLKSSPIVRAALQTAAAARLEENSVSEAGKVGGLAGGGPRAAKIAAAGMIRAAARTHGMPLRDAYYQWLLVGIGVALGKLGWKSAEPVS